MITNVNAVDMYKVCILDGGVGATTREYNNAKRHNTNGIDERNCAWCGVFGGFMARAIIHMTVVVGYANTTCLMVITSTLTVIANIVDITVVITTAVIALALITNVVTTRIGMVRIVTTVLGNLINNAIT